MTKLNLPNLAAVALVVLAGASLMTAVPAAATTLVDGGFEAQAAGVNYCYFGVATGGGPACGPGAWNGATGGGFQLESNIAWPGQPTPDGLYYGFIQNRGYLEQTFTATESGRMSLSWLDAGRPNYAYHGNQSYDVLLTSGAGVQTLGNYATTSFQPFTGRSTGGFNLVNGRSYTLRFQGLRTGGDDTAFIDQVALGAAAGVPEPSAWALMIVGFGMAGSLFRRRRALGI